MKITRTLKYYTVRIDNRSRGKLKNSFDIPAERKIWRRTVREPRRREASCRGNSYRASALSLIL